jgi:hypothetical protein
MCLFMKKLRAAAMELSVNPMLAYIKHLRDWQCRNWDSVCFSQHPCGSLSLWGFWCPW